ncbi:MAG: PKD domain-containing protein [Candidatus Kerfeldbacteria bacterium]|nr:PKD domain-containing protein [Candidatus Kerfeldbacteria bacterium]
MRIQRSISLLAVCTIFFSVHTIVRAQEATNTNTEAVVVSEVATPTLPFVANGGEDRNVIVGRTVLFDASASTGPQDATYTYSWDFGDSNTGEGIDAAHIYEYPGTYRATLTVHMQSANEFSTSTDDIIVSVQDRLVVLLADHSVSNEALKQWQDYAQTQRVLLVPIQDTGMNQEYLTVQNLAQQILQNQTTIASADTIIVWTASSIGLNSLLELSRISSFNGTQLDTLRLSSKAIVALTDQSLSSSAKLAQSVMQALSPRFIVVTPPQAIDTILRSPRPEDIERALPQLSVDYQLITAYTARGLQQLSPFNAMSYAMNFMFNHGVPVNSVYLILMLPVMATIIATARQLVGIKSFGIFAPTVIALSFLSTGLKYGIGIFACVLIIGGIGRLLLKRFRILYLPRMALVLSLLALGVFGMLFVGALFNKTGFIAVSIFPILIMTVIAEHFISVQIEDGFSVALKLTLETLALSVLGFLIGDWALFKTTILAYPELILLTLVVNYLLGKYSGLRLTELLRFRKVINRMHHDQKPQ